jgi:hypothetical protein
MANIIIKDLAESRELDRKALASVVGGSARPYYSPSMASTAAQATMAHLGNRNYQALLFKPRELGSE